MRRCHGRRVGDEPGHVNRPHYDSGRLDSTDRTGGHHRIHGVSTVYIGTAVGRAFLRRIRRRAARCPSAVWIDRFETREFREDLMAERGGFAPRAVRMPVKLQIDEESCARPAVRDEIAHQNVDYVRIRLHRCSNCSYSNQHPLSIPNHCFRTAAAGILTA